MLGIIIFCNAADVCRGLWNTPVIVGGPVLQMMNSSADEQCYMRTLKEGRRILLAISVKIPPVGIAPKMGIWFMV